MKIIGHRGAKGLAPENTIASLEAALKHHVAEIEIDIRVTKDGVPVLNHDPTITQQNQTISVNALTFNELRAIKPDITTFAAAIAAVNRRVPLLVEVKRHEKTAPIISVFREYLAKGWQPTDFLVASFHQKTLIELHKALPEIPTVVIESWSSVRATYRARQVAAKRLNMNYRFLWFGVIRNLLKKGYTVYPYTLNKPRRARHWEKHGLAGVITDYPDRFS